MISGQYYFDGNYDYHDDHDDCQLVISGQDYFDGNRDYHDDCQSVISGQYDLCYLHPWKSLL